MTQLSWSGRLPVVSSATRPLSCRSETTLASQSLCGSHGLFVIAANFLSVSCARRFGAIGLGFRWVAGSRRVYFNEDGEEWGLVGYSSGLCFSSRLGPKRTPPL